MTVVDSKDLPKRPRVIVRIPDTSEITTVMTRLRFQNPELNMTDWAVMSRKVTEKEQTLALSIDPNSFNPLKTNDAYRRRTAPLTSKVAFYIFIQQI